MKITLVTLFPEMFSGPFDYSIVKRAGEKGLVEINIVNLRDFADDDYRTVDGKPYGGGQGMILRVDVIDRCLSRIIRNSKITRKSTKILLTDPRGTLLTQSGARILATAGHLIIIAGHYEGVDERVKNLIDESVSIGEYILSGGELPAMVIVDCLVRLLPGVLKNPRAVTDESFSEDKLLEYPQYAKPRTWKNHTVPAVLLSGNHAGIGKWKKEKTRLLRD
jgi:tRNA (guanine37-N1)-methyltransferase